MQALLLDGALVAATIQTKLKNEIIQHLNQGFRAPNLAVVMLGKHPASIIYVQRKQHACEAVGMGTQRHQLPENTDESTLLNLIRLLNQDESIDGVLVQLPLPAHINTQNILEHIHPNKDVDGFHPYNLGRLAQGHPKFRPCTPFGIMTLLSHYHLDVRGKNAVVVGSSNIVGKPMALELLNAKATVTVCHSETKSLETHIREAHLVVIATGKTNVIHSNWLNTQQILIDVGIHKSPKGLIHGDVDFDTVKNKVGWITPVPGGVGPMTIAMLLHNTLMAARLHQRPN